MGRKPRIWCLVASSTISSHSGRRPPASILLSPMKKPSTPPGVAMTSIFDGVSAMLRNWWETPRGPYATVPGLAMYSSPSTRISYSPSVTKNASSSAS